MRLAGVDDVAAIVDTLTGGRGACGGRSNELREQKSMAISANASAVKAFCCVHPSFLHIKRPVRGSIILMCGYSCT